MVTQMLQIETMYISLRRSSEILQHQRIESWSDTYPSKHQTLACHPEHSCVSLPPYVFVVVGYTNSTQAFCGNYEAILF